MTRMDVLMWSRQHLKAKPFQNKGWPLYKLFNEIFTKVTANGHGAFQPNASQPRKTDKLTGDPPVDRGEYTHEGDVTGDGISESEDEDKISSMDQVQPILWTLTPLCDFPVKQMPLTHSVLSPSLDDPLNHHKCTTPSAAIMRMAKAVSSVAEAIDSDLPQNQLSPQSKHHMDAIMQLQSLDNNLKVDDMVTMTTVFQDIKASDTYIILSKPGMQPEIHHAWVQKMLAKACPSPLHTLDQSSQYSVLHFTPKVQTTHNTVDYLIPIYNNPAAILHDWWRH
ncbi:hypothetical protein BS47DRAFT_1362782 [Hydnum rufescens UP504]|uniref:Uncharacterized protein n=1 Tax=Hydnum rufescens UP504 TaxID=1448309 RepID=A0A9P6AW04_9AGAM|nr:hypothetical protein BS47DRAFT_1362782 [Hydnum rufescens UP504]